MICCICINLANYAHTLIKKLKIRAVWVVWDRKMNNCGFCGCANTYLHTSTFRVLSIMICTGRLSQQQQHQRWYSPCFFPCSRELLESFLSWFAKADLDSNSRDGIPHAFPHAHHNLQCLVHHDLQRNFKPAAAAKVIFSMLFPMHTSTFRALLKGH